MKKFIALVVMLCAVMISSTATAENWKYVCESVDGDKFFVDTSSVYLKEEKKDGCKFSVLVKKVYSEYGRTRVSRFLKPELANFVSYHIERVLFRVKVSKNSVSPAYRSEGGAFFSADGTILGESPHFYSFVEVKRNMVWFDIFIAASDVLFSQLKK